MQSMNWSPEQQAIFEWFRNGQGNLVVQARAGTGKTTTIKQAFSHAPEGRMLYVVFNKKNQIEAAAKITDPRVQVKTLHALGYAFIKAVWGGRVQADGKVDLDRADAAFSKMGFYDVPCEVRGVVLRLVGYAKNCCVGIPSEADCYKLMERFNLDAEDFESSDCGGWTADRIVAAAREVMARSMDRDRLNRISFDDMVWLPVTMGWVRAWFDLVVVDEAQDMNLPQLEMASRACHGRMVVVGDDRQAIYGFRGAAQDGMKMMQDRLGAQVLGLTTTYRCPKAVVHMAAALVPDYKAAPEAPEGSVDLQALPVVLSTIEPGDAILSRLNAPLMPLCLSLLREGKAARIEGRDVGAMLIKIAEKFNARTIPQFLQRLEAWRQRRLNRVAKMEDAERKSAEVNDVADTLQAVAEGAKGVTEISTRLASLFEDSKPGGRPAIVLSTTHKAKGLEWEKVVLLNNTYMRKFRGENEPSTEEHNLYYVAITRSKSVLILSEV